MVISQVLILARLAVTRVLPQDIDTANDIELCSRSLLIFGA